MDIGLRSLAIEYVSWCTGPQAVLEFDEPRRSTLVIIIEPSHRNGEDFEASSRVLGRVVHVLSRSSPLRS